MILVDVAVIIVRPGNCLAANEKSMPGLSGIIKSRDWIHYWHYKAFLILISFSVFLVYRPIFLNGIPWRKKYSV